MTSISYAELNLSVLPEISIALVIFILPDVSDASGERGFNKDKLGPGGLIENRALTLFKNVITNILHCRNKILIFPLIVAQTFQNSNFEMVCVTKYYVSVRR